MKNTFFSVTGAVFVIILGVLLFTSPAFIDRFDISKYNQLGDALNGLTTPIIGLISAFLLYQALTRQTEANAQQRIQMESDILFNLMIQVEKYIEQFYDTQDVTKRGETKTERVTGIEGIHKFSHMVKNMTPNLNLSLSCFYQSGMLLLILRSVNQLEKRLSIAKIDQQMKSSFQEKIEILKELVLKEPLRNMTTSVALGKLKEDDLYMEIQSFINSYERDAKIRYQYT